MHEFENRWVYGLRGLRLRFRLGGCLILLLIAGCASDRASMQVNASPSDVSAPIAVAPEPSIKGAVINSSPRVIDARDTHIADMAAASTTDTSRAKAQQAKVATPIPSPRPVAALPAQIAQAPKTVAPVAPPSLDLKTLKTQLRETPAIGTFTKLTLKNQVDDLLDQFRSFYQGQLKMTLAELRQPFDRLIMKVLALLQDKDPTLANMIVRSREALWGVLADPVKFNSLS